jgi:carbon storage regulator
MLVLSRREGEQIKIGDDVVVTILRALHGKVSVGIDAPQTVVVDRAEVRDRRRPDPPPCTPT